MNANEINILQPHIGQEISNIIEDKYDINSSMDLLDNLEETFKGTIIARETVLYLAKNGKVKDNEHYHVSVPLDNKVYDVSIGSIKIKDSVVKYTYSYIGVK